MRNWGTFLFVVAVFCIATALLAWIALWFQVAYFDGFHKAGYGLGLPIVFAVNQLTFAPLIVLSRYFSRGARPRRIDSTLLGVTAAGLLPVLIWCIIARPNIITGFGNYGSIFLMLALVAISRKFFYSDGVKDASSDEEESQRIVAWKEGLPEDENRHFAKKMALGFSVALSVCPASVLFILGDVVKTQADCSTLSFMWCFLTVAGFFFDKRKVLVICLIGAAACLFALLWVA